MLLRNAFSDRKNLVRGLCDASLIAANISQLRAVLDSDHDNKFYTSLLTLIGLSLLLHVCFGIIIQMWLEKKNCEIQKEGVTQSVSCSNNDCKHCKRYQMYDVLSILVVFFLVVFNVAISGLGLPTTSQDC